MKLLAYVQHPISLDPSIIWYMVLLVFTLYCPLLYILSLLLPILAPTLFVISTTLRDSCCCSLINCTESLTLAYHIPFFCCTYSKFINLNGKCSKSIFYSDVQSQVDK
jgi:hypothetical protein